MYLVQALDVVTRDLTTTLYFEKYGETTAFCDQHQT